jgi:microcystin degradation protein MlrC
MSKLRFALLGFAHESNTFVPGLTGVAKFEEAGLLRGGTIREVHEGRGSSVSGFLAACDAMDVTAVPLVHTFPVPSGIIEDSAFRSYLAEMLQMVEDNGPWDGLLLAQHGAAVAQSEPDVDGSVIEAMRHLVGDDVPIAVAIDLHANVSQRMIDNSTVTVAYRTNPHVDARERAYEAGVLAVRAARGEVRPVQALRRLPLVPEIARQYTEVPPMRDLYAAVASQAGSMLSASMTMGYPYADVPELGMACIAIADGGGAKAQSSADLLARAAWDRRGAMTGGVVPIEEALSIVHGARQEPVLLLDAGDNIGGGAAGDSTVLLHELRKAGLRRVLAIINDPQAASTCHAAGVGGRVALGAGGSSPDGPGPFPLSGTVKALHDGQFKTVGVAHAGIPRLDMGKSGVVESDDGFVILLTSLAVMPISLVQLEVVNINPGAYRVIVAKGVQSPLPAYGPISAEIVRVDTPGGTAPTVANLNYKHRPRPLFPLEREDEQFREVMRWAE